MQVQVILAKFENEESASVALKKIKQARRAARLDFDDTAVIIRDQDGTLRIKDSEDVGLGKGAGRGAIIGGVIGLLAGPEGVIIGAGAGALLGGLFNEGDDGFRDEELEDLGSRLAPDSSAIVAVVPQVWVEEFGHELTKYSDDVSVQVLDEVVAAQLNVDGDDVGGDEGHTQSDDVDARNG